MNCVPRAATTALLAACDVLSLGPDHYRGNATTYKTQRDKSIRKLKLANAAVTDMQMRQRDITALNAKYSRELADARAENETLYTDVVIGRKRLRINATCPGPVREATSTTRVGNATGPQLADTTEQDYFTLRERLTTVWKQLEEAQGYIHTQYTELVFYYPEDT